MIVRAFFLLFVTMCRRDQSGPNKDLGTIHGNGAGSRQKPENGLRATRFAENFGTKKHRLADSCEPPLQHRRQVHMDKSFPNSDLAGLFCHCSAGARLLQA
jgi:hypothetical protein